MRADSVAAAGAAVLDASVALSWVLPTSRSSEALRLQDRLAEGRTPVYVPDLFWSETSNVLRRFTLGRAPSLTLVEARELLDVLRSAPLRTEPVLPLAGRALEIAGAVGITCYDAAYLALAELRDAIVWTTDGRLARAVEGTVYEERVRHVASS